MPTSPESRDADRQYHLDPHRRELRDAAVAEVVPRLEKRGIRLDGDEDSDQLASLLSAIEEFDATVAAHGGDSMLNDRVAAEGDQTDAQFILPARRPGERIGQYVWRITAAQRRIGRSD
ncbi:MAG: hypothetical protein NVS4B3_17190 [Gemmatimonadaceae bacterium]